MVNTHVVVSTAASEPIRLFISYAREERDRVEWLAYELEAAGHKVWWDAALEGGHQFAAEITRELGACDVVLVVWSEDALHSNWVLDEAMVGRDRGCLIPVRFDQTEPPLGFRQIQVIQVDEHDSAGAVAAIGRAIARITDRPVPTVVEGNRETKPSRRRRRHGPVWLPFAWAIFGFIVWIVVSGRYG